MQNRIPSPELAFLEPETYILSQKILQQKKWVELTFFMFLLYFLALPFKFCYCLIFYLKIYISGSKNANSGEGILFCIRGGYIYAK